MQEPGQKGQKPGVPAGKSGGEINLSRAEAAALLVFEREDEKPSMKRGAEMVRVQPLPVLSSLGTVCNPAGASASTVDNYLKVVAQGRPHNLWAPFSGGVRRRCPLAGV